jgi:DNA invertase Pin-like site-specific DNA recombinase
MNAKIKECHLERPAYVYLRQSTQRQVLLNRESTERQYALRDKAIELGWPPAKIRVLDRDLGKSGAQIADREDFKTLLFDVSVGKVGAVVALEASRLARSSLDWHRLIQICTLTSTLVIDEDGIYDPAEINDELVLEIKGTIAQAEYRYIVARLQRAKNHKAEKGELHFPLPVGLVYDETQGIVLDPDEEIQSAIRLLFATFRQKGSAYAVVQHFGEKGLPFPKRAYGGVWAGKLIWGRLTHDRVLSVLKNPSYAGVYVFGRYQYVKEVTPDGSIKTRRIALPQESWRVKIHDHHQGYISWEEYLKNQEKLSKNRTNGEETHLSGPAREGLALLQGLCICAQCGRKLTVRYQGNGGLYPIYECNWRRRDAIAGRGCITVRCDLLDKTVSERILEVLKPAQLQIAVEAVGELERRDEAVCRQWNMRIERADYEVQLAQRRYEEVDPSNRLVAANLERRWNDALVRLEKLKGQFEEFKRKETIVATPEQKDKVLTLAKDFPRLWNAPTTSAKDRKRVLRLLIKDITVEKKADVRQGLLHIRWKGGACETLTVDLPPRIQDRIRYPEEIVEEVRELAKTFHDKEIAEELNRQGRLSAKGKTFTASMIQWVRYKHRIPSAQYEKPGELTVHQVAERFFVNPGVVYYWIERGVIEARRKNRGSPYWITLDREKEEELKAWVRDSSRIAKKQ